MQKIQGALRNKGKMLVVTLGSLGEGQRDTSHSDKVMEPYFCTGLWRGGSGVPALLSLQLADKDKSRISCNLGDYFLIQ